MGGGKKRLDLWLPDDHPVWSFPKGQRSERVRELLDLALRLEKGFRLMEERLARLEARLGRLEEGMARLEEAVAAGGVAVQARTAGAGGGNVPDPAAFLGAFG
jgi:acyl transferase domain-containing protein